jgi:hypothetical protein
MTNQQINWKIIDDFIKVNQISKNHNRRTSHKNLLANVRIAYAIKEATGEIILTTDADCK